MEKRRAESKTDFDRPINKPFEELPESFIKNLHSRMVTLRNTKRSNEKNREKQRTQH